MFIVMTNLCLFQLFPLVFIIFDVILLRKYLLNHIKELNPPMVKLSAKISGQGGREVANPPLEILTIACLSFCLLLTDRPTLGLPEYKLKVANMCKMDGSGGPEVLVLWAF